MSFAKEMEDFARGAELASQMQARNAATRKTRYETGELQYPDPARFDTPGAYQPGEGGGIGTRDAPQVDTPGTGGGGGGKSGGKGAPIAWKGASPEQKAFLMTLSGPESAGDYNIMYGGGHFEGYDWHPGGPGVRIDKGPNAGKTSAAAGRYQFIPATWNRIAKAYHIPDFSPESQDMAAWYLATEEYGRLTKRDLASDLKSRDANTLAGIGKALRGTWTSLPGGIEQGTNTDKFVSSYVMNLVDATPNDPNALKGWSWTNGIWSYDPALDPEGLGAPDGKRKVAQGALDTGDTTEDEDAPEPAPPVDISVPEVDIDTGETPQVEGEVDEYGNPVYYEGGAIPETSFAPGGVVNRANPSAYQGVDKYNANRDFTQKIASTPTVNRGNTGGAARYLPGGSGSGSGQDWRSWDDGTPNQLKFRNRPVTPEPAPAPAPVPAPAPAAPTTQLTTPAVRPNANFANGPARGGGGSGESGQSSAGGTGVGGGGTGGGPMDNRTTQALRAYRAGKATSAQKGWLISKGWLTVSHKEGGAVRTSQTPRSGISKEEFDRMVQKESMRPGYGLGDSPRDRVAKRLSGGKSSAFRPRANQYPDAPGGGSGGGGGKRAGGGGKPKKGPGTSTEPSPKRDPSLSWEQPRTGFSPKRDPSLSWPGDTGGRAPKAAAVPDDDIGAPGEPVLKWSPFSGENTGAAIEKANQNRQAVTRTSRENTARKQAAAPTDMRGEPVHIDTPEVEEEEDFGAPGNPVIAFERGGAIPDEGYWPRVGGPGGSGTTSRTGKRSSALKGKTTKGGGAPLTKAGRKVAKKKPMSRQAAKPRNKKPQADTTPKKPGTSGSPSPKRPADQMWQGTTKEGVPLPKQRPYTPSRASPGPHGGDPGPGRLRPERTTESVEPSSNAQTVRPTRTTESAEPLPSNAQTLRHTGSPRVWPSKPDYAPEHPEREYVVGREPGQQGPPASASRGPSNDLFEFARAGAELVGKEVGNFLERHASPYRGARGSASEPDRPNTGMGGNPNPRGHLAEPPPPGVRVQRPATGRHMYLRGSEGPSTGMGGNPRSRNPLGFAPGGAIPDDDGGGGFPAGGGSYATPPAQGGVADEPGPWGASLQNQPEPTIPVRFEEAAAAASPGVQGGIEFIKRHFGLDQTQTAGVPTPEGSAMRSQGARRFASGEGASTAEEVNNVDRTFAIDEVQADEGTKNLIRIDKVFNYWLYNGNKEKAEAAAASMLLHGGMQVQRAGIMAKTALEEYQQTGDPQDLKNATNAIKKAHSYIPDGVNLEIDIDPKTRQIIATTVGSDGKEQSQVIDAAAIPGMLTQAMDGSAYWKAAWQIGQPRLAEQEMADEAAMQRSLVQEEGENDRSLQRQAWQDEREARINERERGELIDTENRAADREQFKFGRDMGAGKSPAERTAVANGEFFADWNDRLAAAAPGSPEKQQVLAEGLGYTYERTPNRKEPLVDALVFGPESPYAEKFDEDADMVRTIANGLAAKNAMLEGGSAMDAVGALIMAPDIGNTPDGMLSDGSIDLVFNPALLPQLGQLRKKYETLRQPK